MKNCAPPCWSFRAAAMPLKDISRAVRYIRSNAEKLRIQSGRIAGCVRRLVAESGACVACKGMELKNPMFPEWNISDFSNG